MSDLEFHILDQPERDLLLWLSQEDFSQYGECYGLPLNRLCQLGLAQVHQPGEHQVFIANDPAGNKGVMFRAVSLTDAGAKLAAEIKESTARGR